MWLLTGLVVGAFVGVFLMHLMQRVDDESGVDGCTHDCKQGRLCTCKHCYGIGYDASGYACTCTEVRDRFDRESA